MFKVRCATQDGCPLQAIQGLRESSTTPTTRLRNQVSWQSVCLGTVKDRMASLQFKNYSSFHEENTHTNTHTASRLEESSRQTLIIKRKLKYNKAPKEIVSDQREERRASDEKHCISGDPQRQVEFQPGELWDGVYALQAKGKDQKLESEWRVQISSRVHQSPLFWRGLGSLSRSLPATCPCRLCSCIPGLGASGTAPRCHALPAPLLPPPWCLQCCPPRPVSLLVILTFWCQKGH